MCKIKRQENINEWDSHVDVKMRNTPSNPDWVSTPYPLSSSMTGDSGTCQNLCGEHASIQIYRGDCRIDERAPAVRATIQPSSLIESERTFLCKIYVCIYIFDVEEYIHIPI